MPVLDLSEEQHDLLVQSIKEEREAAIAARTKAGLPAIWDKARRQFRGEDVEQGRGGFEKGETLDSPASTPKRPISEKKGGSSVVVNITRPYTVAGTARVADILLPTNRLPFNLKQTPVSDLEVLRGVVNSNPQLQQALPLLSESLAAKLAAESDVVKVATEKAAALIRDWMKESNWAGATRKQINEAGQVGTGVIKAPFPKRRKVTPEMQQVLDLLPTVFEDDPVTGDLLVAELSMRLEYAPHTECIKVENCFPDGDCGSNIQNGRYFFELVPEITRRQLLEYKDDPSYDAEAITKVLEEDPKSGLKDRKLKKGSPYELWIRTGHLELREDNNNKQQFGFQVTTLVNDIIIKSKQYWLDTERFPYHILCWEPREGCWAGIGIAEQIETAQRGVNAAVRALMDNMGFSVGPQILEMDGLIEPADGDWTMHAYKRWKVKKGLPGADAMADAKQALAFLEFQNYLPQIMPVIEFWLKMAENTTGLSMQLQGQAVTDAVGVSQQLLNSSTTNLRMIVKHWDDDTCSPMVTDFYEWVQLYGPEEAKGDAVVEPLGSANLIVRELQQQALLQIGDRVLQPVYDISPAKWMKMYLEGFQVDHESLAMTKEEKQQLQQAEQEPDVKEKVAEIEAAAQRDVAALKDETERLKLALEAQTENVNKQLQIFQSLLDASNKDLDREVKPEGRASAPAPAPAPAPDIAVDEALDLLGA